VDIRVILPDGSRHRERKRMALSSKTAARRWGEQRERVLISHGVAKTGKEVPTLAQFAPRFVEGYARANRHKPSGVAAKESILRAHLIPLFGETKLDAIRTEAVQRLKTQLRDRAPKTVNNVLAVLRRLLSVAVEWGVITTMPCTVRHVKASSPVMDFHDFEAYERLVVEAQKVDNNAHLIVLLGGDAGLRCGEMMALEWSDVDFHKRQLRVCRSEWNGQIASTKGDRVRYVPLTRRLEAALRQHRHLRGPRVLENLGKPLTQKMVQTVVKWAARRAGVPHGVHILRHTFCSRLSMRGAAVRSIQELAGHAHLSTTQRYMHLSPAATEAAIRLLDAADGGEIGETKQGAMN
jgi:integrase